MSTMRVGGLASGMDIDGIVEKLMMAERMPMDKLEQQKQIYEWQRDAYRDVNKKMTTFDTYIADNFILKSLNMKTATSSNSDLVEVVATSAASGTLSIEGVSQLAKAARGVGDVQVNATGATKLSTLGITGTSVSLKAIQVNGELAAKATDITFDENTTVSEFISKINGSDAGVTAIFENGRLSITAKNTGDYKAGAEVQVVSGADVFGKLGFGSLVGKSTGILAEGGTNARFELNGITTERTTNSFAMSGYNVTLKSTFNEVATHNKFQSAENTQFNLARTNLTNLINNLATTYSLTITNPVENEEQLKDNLDAVKTGINNKIIEHESSVETAEKDLKESRDIVIGSSTAGEMFDKLSPEAKDILSAKDNYNELSSPEQQALFGNDAAIFEKLKNVQLQNVAKDAANTKLTNAQAAMTDLAAAETSYNEAKISKDQVGPAPTDKVPASPVTMTATTNVAEIITKVKEFVTTYNGFIKDLTDKTRESKYREYKPLTALQKKEMKEKEIELWEDRSKSGLLRNDSIITSGLSSMRSLVYQTNHGVTNQKYNALYTIGIGTSKDYNSGGILEIDEAKLRKALEEDPDAVVQLLTMDGEKSATITKADGTTVQGNTRGFMRKIRDEMDAIEQKIDGRAGRGSMTETQYTLGKHLRNVNKSLDAWQDKLKAIESRYWKQFGAMESMINKANSQSASLMSQYY